MFHPFQDISTPFTHVKEGMSILDLLEERQVENDIALFRFIYIYTSTEDLLHEMVLYYYVYLLFEKNVASKGVDLCKC